MVECGLRHDKFIASFVGVEKWPSTSHDGTAKRHQKKSSQSKRDVEGLNF